MERTVPGEKIFFMRCAYSERKIALWSSIKIRHLLRKFWRKFVPPWKKNGIKKCVPAAILQRLEIFAEAFQNIGGTPENRPTRFPTVGKSLGEELFDGGFGEEAGRAGGFFECGNGIGGGNSGMVLHVERGNVRHIGR